MNTKSIILIAVLLALLGFAFGRWSAPEKVKTVTQTVEVEKHTQQNQTDTDRDKHREVVTTEVTRPDGTTEKTTKTVEDTSTERKTKSTDSTVITQQTTQTKESTGATAKVTISALVGTNVTNIAGGLVYGGSISKPILGPIAVGLWGLTSGVAGCSVGLSF